MTDEQFFEYKETLLKLVLEKINNSKTLEEAKEKIEALIENQNLYKTKGNLEKYQSPFSVIKMIITQKYFKFNLKFLKIYKIKNSKLNGNRPQKFISIFVIYFLCS